MRGQIQKKFFIGTFVGLLVVISAGARAEEHEHHGAHVHGEAKLVIALESATQGTIDLDCPADSIVGFEHAAKSAKDKKTADAALKKLNLLGNALLELPAALGCTVKGKKAGFEAGSEKGHADINASWDLQCKTPLTGAKGKLHLIRAFTKIHKIGVQIIGPAGQSEVVHTQDAGDLSF